MNPYPQQLACQIQLATAYTISERWITSYYSSDMLNTAIRYYSANVYSTYTMFNLADVH
jgi:hypothetical protein